MKQRYPMLIAVIIIVFTAVKAQSHCEIPCGIYNDQMRLEMILEHSATIEKAMNQIKELEQIKPGHSNQLVRWIMTKESHCNQIQEIVTQYFMTQRIKPGMADYEKQLGLLHQMLLSAMKCKQTTDTANVETLRARLKDFKLLYFAK